MDEIKKKKAEVETGTNLENIEESNRPQGGRAAFAETSFVPHKSVAENEVWGSVMLQEF